MILNFLTVQNQEVSYGKLKSKPKKQGLSLARFIDKICGSYFINKKWRHD
jgi:hypothetical protein